MVNTYTPAHTTRQSSQDEQGWASAPSHCPDAQSPSLTSQPAPEALEAHVATLRDQLAQVETTAATQRERVADLTAQLLRITGELVEARKPEPRRLWWQRVAV